MPTGSTSLSVIFAAYQGVIPEVTKRAANLGIR